MIEEITIKNFQSHEKSVLSLHPGVNVILGSTDSGKSAAIRAVKLAAQNSPAGDSFRSDWCSKEDTTSVELKFTEGNVVRRSIEKGKNVYTLNKSKFKAFGRQIPKEIVEAVNMSDINLQQQHDSHFLLNLTPGQVAAFFNKISNIEVIDTSNTYLKSKISKLNQQKEFQKASLKDKKKQLKEYSYLKEYEEKVEELEQLDEQKKEVEEEVQKISFLLIKLQNVDSRIEELEESIAHESLVNEILDLTEEESKKKKELKKLKALTERIVKLEERIVEAEENITFEALVNNILQLIEEKRIIQAESNSLYKLTVKIQAKDRKLLTMQDNLKKLEGKFHKYMPEVCPLCETELKNK